MLWLLWRIVAGLVLLCWQASCTDQSNCLATLISNDEWQSGPAGVGDMQLSQRVRRMLQPQEIIRYAANSSKIMERLNDKLSANSTADCLALIIEGNFTSKQVQVFPKVAIRYQELVSTWDNVLSNRRLSLWLIGPGSHLWVYRCIEAYDFEMFEIYAYQRGKWLHLGNEGNPIVSSAEQLKVSIESWLEQQTQIAVYTMENDKYKNSSIINIGNLTRLYINGTTNQTFLECPQNSFMQFGRLIESHPIVMKIILQFRNRIINVSINTVFVRRVNSSHALMYKPKQQQFYLGGLDESFSYKGLGWELSKQQQRTGMRVKNKLHGKGAGAATNLQIEPPEFQKLLTALRRRDYLILDLLKGLVYRGTYVHSYRAYGITRFAVEAYIGYHRAIASTPSSKVMGTIWGLAKIFRVSTGSLIVVEDCFVNGGHDILYGRRRTAIHEYRGKYYLKDREQRGWFIYENGTYFIGDLTISGPANLGVHYNNQSDHGVGYFKDGFVDGLSSWKYRENTYKGEMVQSKKHGYGRQRLSQTHWREGFYFQGNFVMGVDNNNGVVTEGKVSRQSTSSQSTIVMERESVFKGHLNYKQEYPLQSKIDLAAAAHQRHQIGAGMTVDYEVVS